MTQVTIDQALQIAIAHHQAGRLSEAEAIYRQILAQQPHHAESLHLLGVIANQVGRNDAAVDLIRRAIALAPHSPEPHSNLGKALNDNGQSVEAIAACRQAIALKPNFPGAYSNLGNALQDMGQFDDAIAAYHQAIALNPNYPPAHNNLGNALRNKGQLDAAIAAYRQAIALHPGYPEAHNNLGNALKNQGRLDEAIAALRQAIALNPNYSEAHSNLLLALHIHPDCSLQTLAEEHRRWNRQHAEPLKKFLQPHPNDRNPERRLRIGYVSPDFRESPVARFLLPLLAHHDKNQVEVFAYAHVPAPDAMTQKLRSHTDTWRNIVGLPNPQLAALIRQDRIDILVDLALHTASNRLLLFAHKPAPVQVTYLAYCSTSGLDTMDYRLSDLHLDPPAAGDRDESSYSEQTLRLPETYWCYEPDTPLHEVSPLPALTQSHITFGCLNTFCKVTSPTLATWCRLLNAVPGSHLLLHAPEGSHRQHVRQQFAAAGIDASRLQFVPLQPSPQYYLQHHHIDIALDPFPYGGGATTCDALWMGVPVVSLAGKTAVGRGGLSILTNIGLPDLVAHSADDYVRIATDLARDLPRLTNLRSTLRQRMTQSPLMDAPRFARNLEAAYRQMWRTWCTEVKP